MPSASPEPGDPPRRIVCLTEEPTEILWALGEGHRIVGLSAWTERPPEAREAAPVVSGFVGGSVDKIVALEPELVIGFSDIQADLASKLIAQNLQVLIFNQRSIAEIHDVIRVLGRIVGRAAEAEALVATYAAFEAEVREAAAARATRPRVYFEEWPDPMISCIRWVSELIEVAGGEDVFAHKSTGKLAKERFIEPADVIAAAPDVILASWCGKPVDKEAIRTRPGWAEIPAVRTGRIHELPSSTILQPGPGALTDGLRQIHDFLDVR